MTRKSAKLWGVDALRAGEVLSPSRLYDQLGRLFPVIAVAYVPTCALFVALTVQSGVPISELTRDPVAVMNAPTYVGLVSNIGVLVWSATVAICVFAYSVIRGRAGQGEWALFLLFAGLLTALLTLDDLFLLHERLILTYVGVGENVTFGLYSLLIFAYMARFIRTILKTEFLLLLLAIGFFGLMLFADKELVPLDEDTSHLFEDGAKLFGIVSWAAYYARVSLVAVVRGEDGSGMPGPG